MKKFWFVLLMVVMLAFLPGAALAQAAGPSVDLNPILNIIVQFAQLAGIAAAISALVNVGKQLGWVKDTTGGQVTAAFDLLALIALIALHYFAPTISIQFVDNQAAVFAQIALAILGYVVQLGASNATHATLSAMKIPLIGFSYSGGASAASGSVNA